MKIAYGSDFHFEFYDDFEVKRIIKSWVFESDTNIIVIAGDLSVGANNIITLLGYIYKMHNIHVVYVPGNHEYYGSSFERENKIFERNQRVNYDILVNGDNVIFDNVNIIGAVGNIDGSYKDINSYTHRSLNDFHQISDFTNNHKNKGIEEFNEISSVLRDSTFKNIVITHTMPHPRCINPKYQGSYMNACFTNDWSEIIYTYEPSFWICGHTHDKNEVLIDKTQIVMNPFGYPHENKDWKWEYITL